CLHGIERLGSAAGSRGHGTEARRTVSREARLLECKGQRPSMRRPAAPQGKQNPTLDHFPFRGRPLGLFGFGASAGSAAGFGGRPLPVCGRGAGSSRNAATSTPRASASAIGATSARAAPALGPLYCPCVIGTINYSIRYRAVPNFIASTSPSE